MALDESSRGLRIAYLINRYPEATHSFIRREIQGLQGSGYTVLRYAARPPVSQVADPEVVAECERTRYLLAAPRGELLRAVAATLIRRPLAFLRAAVMASRLAWRARGRPIAHAAYLAEACLLRHWLEVESVEWLHAHFGTNPAAVAMLVRILGGPPFSFTLHGPEEFERPLWLSLPEKMARASGVVCISDHGRRAALSLRRSRSATPIALVHCGIDTDDMASPASPVPAVARFVTISRLVSQKNPLLLLKGVREVIDRYGPVNLEIVGDGEMRPVVEREIARLGLAENVHLSGWLDAAGIRDRICGARAVVLASMAEGLPVVLMEAYALGRPVIATAVGGVPELVSSDCGWLVPPGSAPQLAGAMIEVLRTPVSRLTTMAGRGRRHVLSQHDARREASRLGLFITGLYQDGQGFGKDQGR